MKNWKKVSAKKPKDEWSNHVTGKRSVSKYWNRRTTKLLWAMRQRKYYNTKNKNNLDVDSYSSVRNCRGGGQISRGVDVPEKYLKTEGGHNKMTLRKYWDHTIKWGWKFIIKWGGRLITKWGEGNYDFYISAFTING